MVVFIGRRIKSGDYYTPNGEKWVPPPAVPPAYDTVKEHREYCVHCEVCDGAEEGIEKC